MVVLRPGVECGFQLDVTSTWTSWKSAYSISSDLIFALSIALLLCYFNSKLVFWGVRNAWQFTSNVATKICSASLA